MKKIEFENSLKCDHEIRKEKELRQAELIKGWYFFQLDLKKNLQISQLDLKKLL